jgi:hypothetical protein
MRKTTLTTAAAAAALTIASFAPAVPAQAAKPVPPPSNPTNTTVAWTVSCDNLPTLKASASGPVNLVTPTVPVFPGVSSRSIVPLTVGNQGWVLADANDRTLGTGSGNGWYTLNLTTQQRRQVAGKPTTSCFTQAIVNRTYADGTPYNPVQRIYYFSGFTAAIL